MSPEVTFVSTSSLHKWRCGQFRLSAGASGRRLRYDCPIHQPLEHGTAVSLQLCTREHTATFRYQLPDHDNISCEWRGQRAVTSLAGQVGTSLLRMGGDVIGRDRR